MSEAEGVDEKVCTASDSWLSIEVDRSALVTADAYGHGLLLAAEAFLAGGADLLGVHTLDEARELRSGGFTCPIIILGPVTGNQALSAADLGVEITLASLAAAHSLAAVGADLHAELSVHLKVETGVNRQGVVEDELAGVLEILKGVPRARLVGLSSHFADIEDTTDHTFAHRQMERFEGFRHLLAAEGYSDLVTHMTCSAATLLWDRTHGDIARVGISAYGIWPSRETRVAIRQENRPEVVLRQAMTWKCRVSQVRRVPAGETVGYGRTWKAMTDSLVAVLPVGYADGWPRALGGRAHVLLGGMRAPIIGRICMNLCMADVTHIPGVQAGDQAVLLGRQGEEVITAEMLADHLGTIAYEVLTLPRRTWRRIPV